MENFFAEFFSAFNVILCPVNLQICPESSGTHLKKTSVAQAYGIRIPCKWGSGDLIVRWEAHRPWLGHDAKGRLLGEGRGCWFLAVPFVMLFIISLPQLTYLKSWDNNIYIINVVLRITCPKIRIRPLEWLLIHIKYLKRLLRKCILTKCILYQILIEIWQTWP